MPDLTILKADARKMPLADESVQCIVTSPPYWGLRKYAGEQETVWDGDPNCEHRFLVWSVMNVDRDRKEGECRCGAWRGAYGLEPTLELYIQHTVAVLRECRRVLRKDGVLFWNIGDSYSGAQSRGNSPPSGKQATNHGTDFFCGRRGDYAPGLKPKDLCLIPQRVALAAQADGWWVRSMIVWAKPNPMPESCTDRPTDAYEHIIMLTKSERYYWDADAVREPAICANSESRGDYESKGTDGLSRPDYLATGHVYPALRNLRNVWTFPTQAYSEAHFATFPEELPRRCILAATSAKGACEQCGAPWERVTKREVQFESGSGKAGNPPDGKHGTDWEQAKSGDYDIRMGPVVDSQTIGWTPTCQCKGQRGKTAPCMVLDPFGGSGTTGRVALELRRRAILLDLAYGDGPYQALAERRTSEVQTDFLASL
jgi:DNA modification methylase